MIQINNIKLHRADCMEVMADYPDNYFDLAVVDPPYGSTFDAIGLTNGKTNNAHRKEYKQFKNIAPNECYFNELFRVSKNQIVWGANFFGLKGGMICWNKNGTAFGEAELAFCSKIKSVRVFEYTWNGMIQQDMKNKEHRIHPTQKPVALYNWILKNYAKPGQKILDTHLGSGSSAIAAHYFEAGEFVGCEIDQDYFDAAVKRIKAQTAQLTMF